MQCAITSEQKEWTGTMENSTSTHKKNCVNIWVTNKKNSSVCKTTNSLLARWVVPKKPIMKSNGCTGLQTTGTWSYQSFTMYPPIPGCTGLRPDNLAYNQEFESTIEWALSTGPWNSFEMGSGIPRASTRADSYNTQQIRLLSLKFWWAGTKGTNFLHRCVTQNEATQSEYCESTHMH